MQKMRYLLIGNYGVGNIGDEALREYFFHSYSDVDWTVVSAHPRRGEVPRFPLGVRSLLRPWWRTFHALHGSDGVVFGGGTLFTDVESVYACVLWWWHAFIARLFGKQVHLAFQGIGPFRTSLGERLARSVVASAATVSVRDLHSFERVKHWRMNKKIILSGLTALVLGGILMTPSVEAYRGDINVKGPNYTQERHEAMTKAFANNDYQAWKELMNGRGRVTQVVTEKNFAKFNQMHQLMLEGKKDEAAKIRAELGLGLQNGSGKGTGMGYGRNAR